MENNVFASFVSASDAQILSAVFYGRCQTWLFEGEKGEIEQFVRRWFPFTHKTLLRILEEGTRKERVCALFSLGQLGYEADRPLLRTYLQSAEEWERWASAIVLWKQREKQAFFVLRSLVCDELEFIERSRHLSQEETIEFDLWSAITRRQAIFTLAWEGSAEVIALFSRTLEKCWERERSLDELLERWETVQNEFFGLEDTLVYLLGQWHVWPPVLQRPLHAGRLRIAQVLWTLGRIHAHETFPIVHRLLTSPLLLFRILTSLTEKNASQYPIALSPSFAERIRSIRKKNIDKHAESRPYAPFRLLPRAGGRSSRAISERLSHTSQRDPASFFGTE